MIKKKVLFEVKIEKQDKLYEKFIFVRQIQCNFMY